MTILLTGSTGFLGSYVAKELQARGIHCRTLKARLHDVQPGDLEGVDTVIHCAGRIPDRGGCDEEFFKVNTEGTRHLLQRSEKAGVRRFIITSSMGVKFPSAYARSKLAAEECVKQSRLEWLILRLAHVYGPNGEFQGLFGRLRKKRICPVLGFGRSPVHIVYVRDCAAAIVDAALSSRTGETFNVMAPECSELHYYRVLREVTGGHFWIVPIPLFLARSRYGRFVVDVRTKGLLIPGVGSWDFSATPLKAGLKQVYNSFARVGPEII